MMPLAEPDWQHDPAGVRASIAAPGAGAFAITAEDWPGSAAARLQPGDRSFVPLVGGGAFLAAEASPGTLLTIVAPQAPGRLRVVFHPHLPVSPALALMAPRALRAPGRAKAYDLAAGRARIDAALEAGSVDTALGVAAEMLLSARHAAATRAAILRLLAHCARYPLARSPALGAFVAALTE